MCRPCRATAAAWQRTACSPARLLGWQACSPLCRASSWQPHPAGEAWLLRCLLPPPRPACTTPHLTCLPASQPATTAQACMHRVWLLLGTHGMDRPPLLTPAMCASSQACWPGRPLLQAALPHRLPCPAPPTRLPACLQPRRRQPRRRLLRRLPDASRAGVSSHCARAVCLLF